MKNRLIILAIFFIGLQSCQTNSMYYDIDMQEIISCSNNGINNLYITNEYSQEKYKIKWKDNHQKPPLKIDLNNLPEKYQIFKSWQNIRISNEEFKLKTNSVYLIERLISDVSPYKIEVQTDSLGLVIKTNKSKCD